MHRCLPLLKNRKGLVTSFSNVDLQNPCSNLLARRRKQNLNRNAMHDLNNYRRKNLNYFDLSLSRVRKVTRLYLLNNEAWAES
jgi:hypothetical protein